MNNNNNHSNSRHIDGIKTYYKAGTWYADFNQYQQIKRQQGIRTSIEVFCSWCDRFDICPQG